MRQIADCTQKHFPSAPDKLSVSYVTVSESIPEQQGQIGPKHFLNTLF